MNKKETTKNVQKTPFLKNEPTQVLSWNLSKTCNYRCSYCVSKNSINKPGAYTIKPIEFLDKFKKQLSGKWLFNVAGEGEPFLTPVFLNIIEALMDMGHLVSINTNLSLPLEDYLRFCDITGSNLVNLTASFHLECADPDEFLKKSFAIKEIVGNKFTVVSPAKRGYVNDLRDILRNYRRQGIYVSMQLEKEYKNNYQQIVQYTKEEEETLKNFRTITKGNMTFKSKKCQAGCRYFVVNSKGEAWRCFEAVKQKEMKDYLGNLLDDTFCLKKTATPCRYDICGCFIPYKYNMIH